LSGILKMIF